MRLKVKNITKNPLFSMSSVKNAVCFLIKPWLILKKDYIFNKLDEPISEISYKITLLELEGLIKTKIKLNNQEVTAYQIKENSKDYIIYGRNYSLWNV